MSGGATIRSRNLKSCGEFAGLNEKRAAKRAAARAAKAAARAEQGDDQRAKKNYVDACVQTDVRSELVDRKTVRDACVGESLWGDAFLKVSIWELP